MSILIPVTALVLAAASDRLMGGGRPPDDGSPMGPGPGLLEAVREGVRRIGPLLDEDHQGDVVDRLREVLAGPLGRFLDRAWAPRAPWPRAGYATRFDPIVPWLMVQIAQAIVTLARERAAELRSHQEQRVSKMSQREFDRRLEEERYRMGPMRGMPGMDVPLDVSKVLDWWTAERPALDTISWREAVARAEAWWNALSSTLRPRIAIPAASPILSWPDGAHIDRLVTQRQLDEEGLSMSHCLRRHLHYWDDVYAGEIVLFSYRDPEGVPQATWEVNIALAARPDGYPPPRPVLVQLQGVGNGEIDDVDAQNRISWFFLSYLGFTRANRFEGHYADRVLQGRRTARRPLWSMFSPYDYPERAPQQIEEGIIDLEEIRQGEFATRERVPARFSKERSRSDLQDEDMAWELDASLASESMESDESERLVDMLVRLVPGVVDLWESNDTVGDGAAWEILDHDQRLFLLQEDRRGLGGGSTWNAVEQGSGRALTQHASTPLSALLQAGLRMHRPSRAAMQAARRQMDKAEALLPQVDPAQARAEAGATVSVHHTSEEALLPHSQFVRRFEGQE